MTARGPAIVGVQSAVTNDQGQYRFPALPPGTYRFEYQVLGFATVVRDQIVVSVGFAATVNVQLQLATLAETVTVTGASPVVDTQNTTIQRHRRVAGTGVAEGDRITRYYDPNLGLDGPIKRDKLWYFISLRDRRSVPRPSGPGVDSGAHAFPVWPFTDDPLGPATTPTGAVHSMPYVADSLSPPAWTAVTGGVTSITPAQFEHIRQKIRAVE